MNLTDEVLNIDFNIKPLVLKAMNKHPNSRISAAKELGVSKRTLHRWVRRYDIQENTKTGEFYFFEKPVKSKLKIA